MGDPVGHPHRDMAKNDAGKLTPLHNRKFSGKQPKGGPDMQNGDMGNSGGTGHGLYGNDSAKPSKSKKK